MNKIVLKTRKPNSLFFRPRSASNPAGEEFRASERGVILVYEVIVMFIFSTVMLAVLSYATMQLSVLRYSINREMAFQIAESGIDYYQWHLAHFPTDYQDGTGGPGPYVHDYTDTDTGEAIGRFSLEITPPLVGSTVVTIRSTGYTFDNPYTKRTVISRYGIPSLAKYAFLTNSAVWIGDTESVSGEMHSNNGIRFDGTGNAPITSSKNNIPPGPGYQCYPSHGCSSPYEWKPGIWGAAPPSTQAFWNFPEPVVDFSTMTSDFYTIKSDAQSEGIYLPPSNRQGYSLVFGSDSVTVYKVYSLRSHQTGWDVNGNAHNEDLDYNNRVFQFTAGLPDNGLIYAEDRTWVEGTVNGRVLVVAASLPYNPTTAPSILIPNNLVYAAKDGSSSVGLIAQKDILITYYSPNTLEIDAALVAQNGSAQRYYFPSNVKNSITIYGSSHVADRSAA